MSSAVVPVTTSERIYNVRIGAGVLDTIALRVADLFPSARGVFLAVDAAVMGTLGVRAQGVLADAGYSVRVWALTPTEREKSVGSWESLLVSIAEAKLERREPVVAIGGGIVGDLAGFAAASYRRGVPVIQCPTTLLSMVDASVGGKTGVNLTTGAGLLKNFVGAFHQPHEVLVETRALETLSDRHFRAGLAECVKHAMISAPLGDPGLFDWTRSNASGLLARDEGLIRELIERNVRLKARVVASDEHESVSHEDPTVPTRAFLNLGHTFAHALEPIQDLSPTGDPGDAPLHHGEAVSLGLVAASHTAVGLGIAPSSLADVVRGLLDRVGLPTSCSGLPGNEEVIARMQDDKKTAGGELRMILPTDVGCARVVRAPARGAICAGIDSIRA